MSEMDPKLASQQTNLMLGGEKWEPSSTNNTTYTWNDPSKSKKQATAAAQALKADYYKAHFELGADATKYTSTNAASFVPPGAQKRKGHAIEKALMKEPNFYFGLQKADMRSMATTDFCAKKVDSAANRAVAAALKKDLRSSHFEFGADPPTLQSSAAADYGVPRRNHAELQAQQREIKVNTTLLRAQNFDTPTHTFYDETSGKQPDPRDYPGSYVGNHDEMKRLKSTLQKTNFMLGESDLDYRSETMIMTGQKKKSLYNTTAEGYARWKKQQYEKK